MQDLEMLLNYTFQNKQLLDTAMTHCSYVNEHGLSRKDSYERLEFLGDAILGALVTEYIFLNMPQHSEGELTQLKAFLVDANACCLRAQQLELQKYVKLGRGEKVNDGKGRQTILANLYEALLGAIYLDGGWDSAKKFLWTQLDKEVREQVWDNARNWKALLQDYVQKNYRQAPHYVLVNCSGPDHNKVFWVNAVFQDEVWGQGSGSSKKVAEQMAARLAYEKITLSNELSN